ncbi:MAG: hypothetical protein EPN37_10305 [Chitinophagaceae bacterium]|nr:MAG: hypothetical protein EPN37_10305 [Chitinophagaceae bacterium]
MILFNKDEAAWVNLQVKLLEDAIVAETGKCVKISIDGVENAEELIIDDIIKITSEVLKVPIFKIMQPNRKHEVIMARYVCFHLIKNYIGKQKLKVLAKIFNKDHTTILHAYREIDDMIATNFDDFISRYDKVNSKIKQYELDEQNQNTDEPQ